MESEARWKRSSYSGAQSDCVEMSHHLNAARDSKNPEVALRVNVRRLLDAVKEGSLTR